MIISSLVTGMIIGGAIAGGSSIAAAAIGSRAAGKAGETQARAAETAAELEARSAREALAFQKQQWETYQRQQAPFLKAGQGAVTTLASLMGPGGELTQPWGKEFAAPTTAQMEAEPGFQFRLAQGQQAIERSAAARGGLLTGGTGKALTRYGQEYASGEYQNVYNRALTEYQQAYNIFQQGQANQYNRYAGMAGMGQTTAAQLGQTGAQTAGSVSNILMGSAAQQSQALQNAAAARASGYVGGANAWGGAVGGIGSNISNLLLLSSLLGKQPQPTGGYV